MFSHEVRENGTIFMENSWRTHGELMENSGKTRGILLRKFCCNPVITQATIVDKPPIFFPLDLFFIFYFLFMHFCPGTITTHAESINSDLLRGLDRRLRHIQHWTQNRTSWPSKYQRTTNTAATLVVQLRYLSFFLQIQIPTDRTNGTRTCATQMLTNTIIEICSTRLTTALDLPW